jgi:hypothetical protein
MGTAVVMIKTQIGLGVLSIPAAFDTLGLIPGVLCLLGVGAVITWGNHVVGSFKRNHPEVYSIVDVGEKLGGKVGKEFMSVAFMLCKSHHHQLHLGQLSNSHQGGSVSRLLATRVSRLLLTPSLSTALALLSLLSLPR